MSTVFSHVVIPLSFGLGLGRHIVPFRVLLLGCLFAVLPDIDVIGFELGVSYYSPWGHRGFTHSIAFAVFCGLLAALYLRYPAVRSGYIFLFLALSMISHGVLDAMTYGGLGIGLGWPFTDDRYFFPWRPLPISPIGVRRFFNHWGLYVIKKEALLIWLPMLGCFLLLWSSRMLLRIRKESRRDLKAESEKIS